jgi:hypothetical protein
VISTVREVRHVPPGGVIVVGGAPALVPILVRELREGGDPGAVREGPAGGAERAALVWIGAPDLDVLRATAHANVPIIAVTDADYVPYVLDTDLVHVPAGQGFPVDEIAAALARRLGDRGPALAAALPVLRTAVVDELTASTARHGALAAAGFLQPRTGMVGLTVRQIRLVMRIAVAHGREIDRSRVVEAAAAVGAGLGFRALARVALARLPGPAWPVRAGVFFAGTAALGAAARRRFGASVRTGS